MPALDTYLHEGILQDIIATCGLKCSSLISGENFKKIEYLIVKRPQIISIIYYQQDHSSPHHKFSKILCDER